jgi:hypothetical protein
MHVDVCAIGCVCECTYLRCLGGEFGAHQTRLVHLLVEKSHVLTQHGREGALAKLMPIEWSG